MIFFLYDFSNIIFKFFFRYLAFLVLLACLDFIVELFKKDFHKCTLNSISKFLDTKTKYFCFVLVYFLFVFTLIFSNKTIVHIFGETNLKTCHEGTYCYYVKATNEKGKTYTLPAKLSIEYNEKSGALYTVENVYFKNGGYLYFSNPEPVEYNQSMYVFDQNENEWEIELTNKKAPNTYFKESKFYNAAEVVLCIFVLIIATFEFCYVIVKNINMHFLNNNIEIVKKLINQIMDNANSKNIGDCKTILSKQIEQVLSDKGNIAYIKNSKNKDLQSIAYKTVFNVSYNLLTSGQLHIARGMLNTLLPCNQLIDICKMSWEFAVKNGDMTQNQMDEQIKILFENIEDVG